MPLFRRKSTNLLADAIEANDAPVPAADDESADLAAVRAARGYTPPKGRETPKRTTSQRRRVVEPPPANRREAYRRERDRRRRERAEAAEGMRRGDERYLLPRDRGPERLLVRNIVDSRRTAGTWFFGGALLVIIGSSGAMPPMVQVASNVVWIVLALAVVVDSLLISRRIKRLVRERFPRTEQRMRSLYLYGIMRGLTFRRMRIPAPQVKLGDKV